MDPREHADRSPALSEEETRTLTARLSGELDKLKRCGRVVESLAFEPSEADGLPQVDAVVPSFSSPRAQANDKPQGPHLAEPAVSDRPAQGDGARGARGEAGVRVGVRKGSQRRVHDASESLPPTGAPAPMVGGNTEGDGAPDGSKPSTGKAPRKQVRAPFVKMPVLVLHDGSLSMQARLLYAALLRRDAARNGRVWPGYRWLCNDIGWSLTTLNRYLRELSEHGLITVNQERTADRAVITLVPLDEAYEWQNAKEFAKLPWAVVCDYELPVQARLLYGAIVSFGWRKRLVWVGEKRLAGDLGCSRRTVSTYLQELADRGLVTSRRRFRRTSMTRLNPLTTVYSSKELACRLTVWRDAHLKRVDWHLGD